jgi:hypothetical protein
MTAETNNYTLSNKGSLGKISLITGVLLVAAGVTGYFMNTNSPQFFQSYLLAYLFWLSIALGGLFFTLITHLFGAEWSIVLRRISESVMYTFPLLAILFIPILFGMHDLYHWTHEDVVAQDAILQAKSGYLNFNFFVIRAIIYFTIWFILSRILYKLSLKQDKEPSDALILKMNKVSAPGIILFALSLTFAAFDWIMSLDPHWFSTIFGVYYFGGSFLAIICFIILLAFYLRSKGYLEKEITVEHYHDLSKLIFAFLIFWGYIGFSQYFLIWYANIPEETVWYLMRWENGWYMVTMLLVFGHFVIPFVTLTFRATKRKFTMIKIVSVWVLLMHFVDLYWLAAPTFAHGKGPYISWMDLVFLLGMGGLFVWNVWQNISNSPLIPVGDRRLQKSIKHIV